MKRILALLLSIAVLISLGACTPDEDNAPSTDEEPSASSSVDPIAEEPQLDGEKTTTNEPYVSEKEPIAEEPQPSSGAASHTTNPNASKPQVDEGNVIAEEPQLDEEGNFVTDVPYVGSGVKEDPPFQGTAD